MALLREDDEEKEVEVTLAMLLPLDCYTTLLLLTSDHIYSRRESLCLRWQMEMRPSSQQGDPGTSLCASYRPGESLRK